MFINFVDGEMENEVILDEEFFREIGKKDVEPWDLEDWLYEEWRDKQTLLNEWNKKESEMEV